MAEKTEWPSEKLLADLRDRGLVPLSPFACRCGATLGFLLSFWAMRSRLEHSLDPIATAFRSGSLAPLAEALRGIALVVGVPLLVASLSGVVVGLLQTKFLFSMNLLSVKTQRLGRWGAAFHAFFSSAAYGLVGIVLCAACGLLALRLGWTGLLYVLNNDKLYLTRWVPSGIQLALAPLAAVLAIGAVLAWFIARLRFMLRHRVSREELERDSYERDIII